MSQPMPDLNHTNQARADVDAHLADLPDDALIVAFNTAKNDLALAANGSNPDWHEACFAGALIYATELQKRGIILATKH